jgi:hypothetical protein
MRRAGIVLVVGISLALGGCFAKPAGTAFPAGCGTRSIQRTNVASTAPVGTALPIYGAPVPEYGIAAGGGMLAAFAGPAWAVPDALYVSSDQGLKWQPVPVPSGVNGSLSPVALSADGSILAGSDLAHLYTRTAAGWKVQAVNSLLLLTFAGDRTVGLGGENGHALLYVNGAVQATLPLALGHGQGLAILGGAAIVALGQAAGPARLFAVPLAGGVAPTLPAPPSAAASPVRSLAAGPDGSLYLATGGGLFVLPPHGGSWAAMALPSGAEKAPHLYLGFGSDLYVAADTADDVGSLWRRAGGAWQRVELPHGFVGQPVADGASVWVPTNAGPVVVGAAGSGQIRAAGIATPVSVVASAAWKPTRVAAGWSGGIYVSLDGGRTWVNRTPPGSALVPGSLAWTPDGGCLVATYGGIGTAPPQVYLSGDAGASWSLLAAPGDGRVTAVVEAPVGSGVWWVAEGGKAPGLYRSAPGRVSWTAVALPVGAALPSHLAAGGNLLWLSTLSSGVWKAEVPSRGWWARVTGRSPAAPVWTRVWGAGVAEGGLAADPYAASDVYSGRRRTEDGGVSWSVPALGAVAKVPGGADRGMLFGSADPGAVMVTTAALLHDDGQGWQALWSPPGPDQYITGAAPAGSGRFYVAVQKLGLVVVDASQAAWRAPAHGAVAGTWTMPASPPQVRPLQVAAPSDPSVVYRVTFDGQLSVSRDGGRSFGAAWPVALAGGNRCCTAGEAAGPRIVASTLAVAATDPQRVYVGLALQGAAGWQPRLGVWVSEDGGRSWQATGMASNMSVTDLVVTPGALDAVAYPGFVSGSTALWRSADGGATWTKVSGVDGPVYSVAVAGSGTVLAGGQGAVWRSTNGGRSFTRLAVDLPIWSKPVVTAVLQAPDGTLYAGTGAGVAASADGGKTWRVISEAVGDPPVLPGGLSAGPGGAIDVRTQVGTFAYRP